MTRRLLGAAAIGCALLLAGCNTPQTEAKIDAGVTAGVAVANAVTANGVVVPVSRFQAAVLKGCRFEMIGTTAASIIGTLTGYSSVSDLLAYGAQAVCTAAKSGANVIASADGLPAAAYAQASSSSSNGSVNDVPVKGRFVSKKERSR